VIRLGSSTATLPSSLSPCQIACPHFIFPNHFNSFILKLNSIYLHSSSSLARSLNLPSTSLLGWLRVGHRVQHSGCKCPAFRLDTHPVSPSPGHILRSSPHLPRRDRITDPSRAPDNTVDNVKDPDRLYELLEIIVLIGRYGVHVVQYVPSCDASTDHVACSGPHHGHHVTIVNAFVAHIR
jgi:hypothetical protein